MMMVEDSEEGYDSDGTRYFVPKYDFVRFHTIMMFRSEVI